MGPWRPVLHFYRMKFAANLVGIIITNSRTLFLQPFPDYANRPARQEPVIKPARRVSAGLAGRGFRPPSKFLDVQREQVKQSSSHLLGSILITQEFAVALTLGKRVNVDWTVKLEWLRCLRVWWCLPLNRPADIQADRKYFLLPFRSLPEWVAGGSQTAAELSPPQILPSSTKSPRQKITDSVTFRASGVFCICSGCGLQDFKQQKWAWALYFGEYLKCFTSCYIRNRMGGYCLVLDHRRNHLIPA